MKKTIIIFLLLIPFFSFAEEFKGFLGIPFGSSKKEFCQKMVDKGWYIDSDYGFFMYFTGKQYAGKDIRWIDVGFENNCFDRVTVYFNEINDAKEVMQAIIKKYELDDFAPPMYFTPDDRYCFIDGDEFITISDTTDYSSTIESDI